MKFEVCSGILNKMCSGPIVSNIAIYERMRFLLVILFPNLYQNKTHYSVCNYVLLNNLLPVVDAYHVLPKLHTAVMSTLQTRSLYKLQGSPCVVILPCKNPVKITGYHSSPSSYVVGT